MKRKEFISNSTGTLLWLSSLPVLEMFASPAPVNETTGSIPAIGASVQDAFNNLLTWMKNNGWRELLHNKGIKAFDITDVVNYTNPLSEAQLNNARSITGCDDFGGIRLIERGNPSLSLLYHLLASPRVIGDGLNYPDITQLDAMENMIYAMKEWGDISKQNDLHLAVLAYEYRPAYKTPVFDPTFNQPVKGHLQHPNFKKYAQMVYSRAGIARVGQTAANYDPQSRSYTNKPASPGDEKKCAVTPARYGLFLVQLVTPEGLNPEVKVMNLQDKEYVDKKGHKPRYFIKPIRKIYNDECVSTLFGQYHLNEKILKLAKFSMDKQLLEFSPPISKEALEGKPFKRCSCADETNMPIKPVKLSSDKRTFTPQNDFSDTDTDLVHMERHGNSVLLLPVNDPNGLLIKEVTLNDAGQIQFFRMPEEWSRLFGAVSNHRYLAFKATQKKTGDIYAFAFESLIFRGKRTSELLAPRNAPLFANAKFVELDSTHTTHLGSQQPRVANSISQKALANGESIEDFVKAGNYDAALFQDNICDGCISAKIIIKDNCTTPQSAALKTLQQTSSGVLPALSIVAAPDFFPFVDSNDIRAFYYKNSARSGAPAKLKVDENFQEGGTINLSGIRARANSDLLSPFPFPMVADALNNMTDNLPFKALWEDDHSFDSLTAIVANNDDSKVTGHDVNPDDILRINYLRNYNSASYLPDTGTGILYPGWDVTYSNDDKFCAENNLIATYGLGAPFPEDMKLCAAANGMWPVESPDAGRTFWGSLSKGLRPTTSIPLMDDEIGYHKLSPHGGEASKNVSWGWDGEQGPCLRFTVQGDLAVNFTDVGRADYVFNLLHGQGFDMSKLRGMTAEEAICRIQCMTEAIRNIDHNKNAAATKFWLVGAEKVDNWATGANAWCIPQNLLGNNNEWAKKAPVEFKGKGYLFVFVKTIEKGAKKVIQEFDKTDPLRRNQEVKRICICQIAKSSATDQATIRWCGFNGCNPAAYKLVWNKPGKYIDWL